VGSGGAGGATTSSGGATSNGGTLASGGQAQGGSISQGGAASGGKTASGGTTGATGGKTGGSPSGGAVTTGGEVTTGGTATGGAATGGAATGGKITAGGTTATTGGASTGGKTTAGGTTGTTGGAAAGGKTTTGGTTGATGGAATGGVISTGGGAVACRKTAAGGTTGASGGSVAGGTTAAPAVLGSSDGTTPIKVWMAGDSTMAGSGCANGGWGDQFASVFNKQVTIVNSSVAGRSIQTWLYDPNVTTQMDENCECIVNPKTYNPRWTAMLDANTGMKPGDYLFIEFGINDATTTCEAGKTRHVGSDLFQTYLTTMAQAAETRGAQPIFLTSTSGLQCSGSTAQPNRSFGPETKAAGAADNVVVIDMTTLTAALYTKLGLCPNNGDMTAATPAGDFFCNDTTHFSPAGALQIAQTAAQALKDQGVGLAAYLVN
jgi:lysophospholipase L1-like esterase